MQGIQPLTWSVSWASNTTDRATLEVLAGVPAGTYDRLDATLARHEANPIDPRDQEAGFARWKEINDDGPMGNLDNFLTFGWGKFSPIDGIGEDCAGHEDDLDRAAKLLAANGIEANPQLTAGVHWS